METDELRERYEKAEVIDFVTADDIERTLYVYETLAYDAIAALTERDQRIAELEADADRLAEALEAIAGGRWNRGKTVMESLSVMEFASGALAAYREER